MKVRVFLVIAVIGFVCAGVFQASAKQLQIRRLAGTWTCAICDAKGLEGNQTECESLGHKHALKLQDGTYVTFQENERSASLIQGGGRHKTKIEVYGFFDPDQKTLDVDCYQIDGKWTSWCEVHKAMDLCRGESGSSVDGAK